jgi:undecaprenyl-diphosphatase
MPARFPAVRARLLAAVCLGFFVLGGLGRLALGDGLTRWDQEILLRVASERDPGTVAWMKALSWIGGGWFPIVIGLIVTATLIARRERTAARCYLVTVLSGWGLNLALKVGFQRPRPDLLPRLDGAGGYSYPSGHAMLAPLVFLFGAYLLTRYSPRWVAGVLLPAAALLSLGIGASRVYLAVHYPSDVLGALLGGIAWSALGIAIYSPLDRAPGALPGARGAR